MELKKHVFPKFIIGRVMISACTFLRQRWFNFLSLMV
jgi:hypothetical protein